VKNLLLAGIALVALAAPAAAADMPLKAPAPVAIDIWTGGYVGANVGYDWGRDTINSTGAPGNCTSTVAACAGGVPGFGANLVSPVQAQQLTFQTSLNRSGVIYGGQAGHNWLVHNIAWTWDGVLGVEVDFQGKSDSHSNTLTSLTPFAFSPVNALSQTATLTERIDTLGTLRGRAGLLWGPNTLIYATAGVAWASVRASNSYSQSITGPGVAAPNLPGIGNASISTELFGPVVGGGVEWKWTANWSIKAEYLYADLGNLTMNSSAIQPIVLNGPVGTATAQTTTHFHDNIARVGVNYRFW
jgi:outer membrane immunogenic protein